jgi:Ni/Co efflux regulator RcnB
MKNKSFLIAACVASIFSASGTALAEKPSWAGEGKHGKQDGKANERYDDDRRQTGKAAYFNDDAQRIIGDYYGTQARAGKCPPGLAKKHNGCQPPGQAKKWSKGHPLPADLRYYDLPRDLLMRLPPPPPRHRYVQVAGDVLMIAIGTSMVVDAMEDILR